MEITQLDYFTMRIALAAIANGRHVAKHGGNISRHGLIQLAREACMKTGIEWDAGDHHLTREDQDDDNNGRENICIAR